MLSFIENLRDCGERQKDRERDRERQRQRQRERENVRGQSERLLSRLVACPVLVSLDHIVRLNGIRLGVNCGY
jgi:hypothetical protein